MMKQKKPDDYILATGETHSIKEFVREACKIADIPLTKIKSQKSNLRPNDIQVIKGNYSKAKKILYWKPKTKFKKGLYDTFSWYLNNKNYYKKINKKDILNRLGLKND